MKQDEQERDMKLQKSLQSESKIEDEKKTKFSTIFHYTFISKNLYL